MPVKGLKETRRAIKQQFEEIEGEMTERTLTEILIIGAGYAATLTPIDTSALINSQYRRIEGNRGYVGYTAAYAAAVHNAEGVLMGQQRPGNRGTYWAPGGEPEFLRKGFEELGRADIKAAIKRGYKL